MSRQMNISLRGGSQEMLRGAGLALASPLPGLLPVYGVNLCQSLTFHFCNDGQVGRGEVGTVDKAFWVPFVASEDEISVTACCFSQCVYLCNGWRPWECRDEWISVLQMWGKVCVLCKYAQLGMIGISRCDQEWWVCAPLTLGISGVHICAVSIDASVNPLPYEPLWALTEPTESEVLNLSHRDKERSFSNVRIGVPN